MRTLRKAIRDTLDEETDLLLRVAVLTAADMPRHEIAARLGVPPDEIKAAIGRLKRCAVRLER